MKTKKLKKLATILGTAGLLFSSLQTVSAQAVQCPQGSGGYPNSSYQFIASWPDLSDECTITKYQWSNMITGETLTSGIGSLTGSEITVSFANCFNNAEALKCTMSGTCTDENGNTWTFSGSAFETFTTICYTTPTVSITPLECNTVGTVTVTATPQGTTGKYYWTLGAGISTTSPNPSNTNTIVATVSTATANPTVKVYETILAPGTYTTSAASATVTRSVAAPTYSGSNQTSFCLSSPVQSYSINAIAGATSYNWAITGAATFTSTGGTTITGTTATTEQVKFTSAGTYTLSVTTNTSCGTATSSQVITVYPTTLPMPTGFMFTQMAKTCYFRASVTAIPGAEYYEWSTTSNFASYLTSASPISPDDYDQSRAYILYVKAINPCATSPVATFNRTTPSAGKACLESPIKDEPATATANDFKLFPNPANAELTIQYTIAAENTGNVNIDVYDMLGKKVESWTLSATETSATENVSGLAKGMYIYMITSGDNILQRGKVMIQR